MPAFRDITGQRFGRLVAIRKLPEKRNNRIIWEFQCDCGKVISGSAREKLNGTAKSCGCLQKERASQENKTHGLSKMREYKIWKGIKIRCFCPTSTAAPHYSARGITMCERWRNSFENFLADMGPRPSPRHSIDRIDVNGNYEPENCRWATAEEQTRNTRMRKDNTSGVRGVYRCNGRWRAFIGNSYIGAFKTKEEAANARKEVEAKSWQI